MSEIIIYQNDDNQVQVEVRFENETVWLNRQQLALLFDRDIKTIGKHINNVFRDNELEQISVVANFATTASDGKTYQTEYYNLDVIISVGYRVKSKRGVQFRKWATKRLKEYLVEGYSINRKRLEERNLELTHLKNGISILHRAIEIQAQSLSDSGNLVKILDDFSRGLSLLDDYDHNMLDTSGKTKRESVEIGISEYRSLINAMRNQFSSDLFGREKDKGFESSIKQIYQSYGGIELYSSLEEKAAMLLYLIVKNHAFVDGNKRIAAACFLNFLERNGMLYNKKGIPILSEDSLAAMTLFIAVSKPNEMKTVKEVIISMLNRME